MAPKIAIVVVLATVLLCCNNQLLNVELTLENFEQTLGKESFWLDLRVRKYNRTASVINGTVFVYVDATNDYQCDLDIFYSRLGNQQFNHMPLKLPSAGVCDFIDNLYERYPKEMTILVNGPKKGECPVTPREIYIQDALFPADMVPKHLIKIGLYKGLVRCYVNEEEVVSYYLVVKAASN
uniref:MD-2-related lipid-recognition domain-containing protein n=1 Tax=Anopheles culicifacies TaxID=139723 RepID=A0A182MF01_9DIPT